MPNMPENPIEENPVEVIKSKAAQLFFNSGIRALQKRIASINANPPKKRLVTFSDAETIFYADRILYSEKKLPVIAAVSRIWKDEYRSSVEAVIDGMAETFQHYQESDPIPETVRSTVNRAVTQMVNMFTKPESLIEIPAHKINVEHRSRDPRIFKDHSREL